MCQISSAPDRHPNFYLFTVKSYDVPLDGFPDMATADFELAAILQSGRWKIPAMVARYTENLVARRADALERDDGSTRLPVEPTNETMLSTQGLTP